ncbi:MAG: hypothetical protein R3248_07295 [Candidatus Promineifilaceae bacterium]|nr:hypothetical protein [Candidatus Promineifilaceae bacterium]
MRQRLQPTLFLIIALITAALACAIPGTGGTPTPPPSPTPVGDTIFFTAPYAITLEPGTTIPGTEITFVQQMDALYELRVEGLRAVRQDGDALTWRGIVAPGVFGTYRLRLRSPLVGQLRAEGDVDLAVLNPAPVELPPTDTPPAGSVHYNSIPVQYFVPEGHRIPGSTLVYDGQEDGIARLSGTAGYPYFALDASILWLGKLRENVYIRYNTRVSSLNENGLGLTGTAELWVTE